MPVPNQSQSCTPSTGLQCCTTLLYPSTAMRGHGPRKAWGMDLGVPLAWAVWQRTVSKELSASLPNNFFLRGNTGDMTLEEMSYRDLNQKGHWWSRRHTPGRWPAPLPIISGPRPEAHGPRPMARGLWFTGRGPWPVAHGPRPTARCPWPKAHGPRAHAPTAYGPRPVAHGLWAEARGPRPIRPKACSPRPIAQDPWPEARGLWPKGRGPRPLARGL